MIKLPSSIHSFCNTLHFFLWFCYDRFWAKLLAVVNKNNCSLSEVIHDNWMCYKSSIERFLSSSADLVAFFFLRAWALSCLNNMWKAKIQLPPLWSLRSVLIIRLFTGLGWDIIYLLLPLDVCVVSLKWSLRHSLESKPWVWRGVWLFPFACFLNGCSFRRCFQNWTILKQWAPSSNVSTYCMIHLISVRSDFEAWDFDFEGVLLVVHYRLIEACYK